MDNCWKFSALCIVYKCSLDNILLPFRKSVPKAISLHEKWILYIFHSFWNFFERYYFYNNIKFFLSYLWFNAIFTAYKYPELFWIALGIILYRKDIALQPKLFALHIKPLDVYLCLIISSNNQRFCLFKISSIFYNYLQISSSIMPYTTHISCKTFL